MTDFEEHFCVGSTSVYRILGKLEDKGFIKRIQHKPRSIELLISEDDIPDLENGVSDGKGDNKTREALAAILDINRFKG